MSDINDGYKYTSFNFKNPLQGTVYGDTFQTPSFYDNNSEISNSELSDLIKANTSKSLAVPSINQINPKVISAGMDSFNTKKYLENTVVGDPDHPPYRAGFFNTSGTDKTYNPSDLKLPSTNYDSINLDVINKPTADTSVIKDLYNKSDYGDPNLSDRNIFDGVYKSKDGTYMDTNFFTKDSKANIRDLTYDQAVDAKLVDNAKDYKLAGGGSDIMSSMDYLKGSLGIGQLAMAGIGLNAQLGVMKDNLKTARQNRDIQRKEYANKQAAINAAGQAFSQV